MIQGCWLSPYYRPCCVSMRHAYEYLWWPRLSNQNPPDFPLQKSVVDSDPQIRGGRSSRPWVREGGGGSKITFSALRALVSFAFVCRLVLRKAAKETIRASVWSKNKGGGADPQAPPLDPPLKMLCWPLRSLRSRPLRGPAPKKRPMISG